MHPHDIPSVDVAELPGGVPGDWPDDIVLLDVREDDEWRAGHVEGAIHVPMHSVPQRLAYDPGPITPETPLVVVCKVGGRSAQVTAWLRGQGYDARNLAGGMLAWHSAGRAMVAEGAGAAEVL